MNKNDIQNLVKELVEGAMVKVISISTNDSDPKNTWISVEVNEPHFFIGRGGEALQALNHIVHRIIENKTPRDAKQAPSPISLLVDINDFQKKKVDSVRAVAHMMSERARYFKSSVEVDPMSAFERRIVHEFLSDATDLKTESTGEGTTRRVVIKYTGTI